MERYKFNTRVKLIHDCDLAFFLSSFAMASTPGFSPGGPYHSGRLTFFLSASLKRKISRNTAVAIRAYFVIPIELKTLTLLYFISFSYQLFFFSNGKENESS